MNQLPILIFLAAAASGEEQPRVEEITVTADLRADTPLRELPVSATVLDEASLREAGEQHFQETLELIPNLNWSSATNRPRFLQIRGIGERSQYEGAPNPSVGFVIDDIDFSGIGTLATLFDTERVEVLRGPQGTRYGASALAGLVYVRTAEPTFTPELRLQGLIGDDGARAAGVAAGGPLGQDSTAAYRVSLHRYAANGFRFNDYLMSDSTNERLETAARARLRWLPSHALKLDFSALYADIDNGFDAFAPENTFVVHSDQPGRDAQRSLGLALRATWTGWEWAELVSISSAAESDVDYSFDGDWGNPTYWGEFSPYDFTSATDRERRTVSQELRLVAPHWVAGVYLLKLEESNRFNDRFNGEVFRTLVSDYEALSAAAFGQLDHRLGERGTLTLGLRLERRAADYVDDGGLDLEPRDTMAGGRLALARDLGAGQRAYLSLARGYKAGGFNLGLSVPEARREFAPEQLWSLEAGLKGSFQDGRLSTQLALFHAWRDDIQVGTSFQVDPTDPLTFVFFTDNAASGVNYGLEAEFRCHAGSWDAFGALGLLKTRFEDFATPERDLAGRKQAHAPGYQLALGGEYRFGRGWFARAELTARDEFFYSDSHDQVSEPYELVNLKLGYRGQRWEVYAWGRNVFDQDYATRGFFFGLEPPEYPNRLYLQKGDPRHLGITLRWQLGGEPE